MRRSGRTNKMLPPVTRLVEVEFMMTNGIRFNIIHDLPIKVFEQLMEDWQEAETRFFTPASFCQYVKMRKPSCICLKKSDYDSMTKGKAISATKEEWEQENN